MLRGNSTFDSFIARMESLIAAPAADEQRFLEDGQRVLGELVASDEWLPTAYAEADARHFKQYMLYNQPGRDFTVLCVVWGPGQSATPHNHTVWGMIGQLRGAERSRVYEQPEVGQPLRLRSEKVLLPGQTTALSPTIGDIHDVANVADGVSISIHVYGGDLERLASRRSRYDAQTGAVTPFHAQYH